MDLELVRDTLGPIVDEYLSIHRRVHQPAAQRAAGERLGRAFATLPATDEALRAVDAYASALSQVARPDTGPGAGAVSLWPTLALLTERLRFALRPPPVAPTACDCALRRAFSIAAPPEASRLEPEGADAGARRCRSCGQRWVEDASEAALFTWARWRPADRTWAGARPPVTPWSCTSWSTPMTPSTGCRCALVRWFGSRWIGPPAPQVRWNAPPGDEELLCDVCGQGWRRTTHEETRPTWALVGAAVVEAVGPVLDDALPEPLWHAPCLAELLGLAESFDALLAWRVPADRRGDGLFELGRRLEQAYQALPLDDATVEAARWLSQTFVHAGERQVDGRQPRDNLMLLFGAPVVFGVQFHLQELAYRRAAAAAAAAPCDCALLIEQRLHGLGRGPSSDRLVVVREDDDPYERATEYRCEHCGRGWRLRDTSTEQFNSACWDSLESAPQVAAAAPPAPAVLRSLAPPPAPPAPRAPEPVVPSRSARPRRAPAPVSVRPSRAASDPPWPVLPEPRAAPPVPPADPIAWRLVTIAGTLVALTLLDARLWGVPPRVAKGAGVVTAGLVAALMARRLGRLVLPWALASGLLLGLPGLLLATLPPRGRGRS